jgi:hypothetical protein
VVLTVSFEIQIKNVLQIMTTEYFQEIAHKSRGEVIGFRRGVGVCKAELAGEESSVDECLVLG